ncbi:rhomboid family intramembrane serine protease [Arthrobacter sp.]|uniref:rhomboid family intramembrane serine protease n=1 Tax=Arthrobacter sp. TaxID=1667 RepID=UPI002586F12D|nr:rhomboid family intramembrane serine protease [Arthrobacter sp.]
MSLIPEQDEQERPGRSRVATAAVTIGGFVLLLWVIELVDAVMGHRLDSFGIRPWNPSGLSGILFAPLLHLGWGHLIANTGPLLVLGFVILLSGVGAWLRVTAVVWLVGGIGTWLTGGPGSLHLGASGLVFGWIVYLVLRGVFTRSVLQIALGVVILLAYGAVLWGVFPGQTGISWQGHLFGAIGGGLAARLEKPRQDSPEVWPPTRTNQ